MGFRTSLIVEGKDPESGAYQPAVVGVYRCEDGTHRFAVKVGDQVSVLEPEHEGKYSDRVRQMIYERMQMAGEL